MTKIRGKLWVAFDEALAIHKRIGADSMINSIKSLYKSYSWHYLPYGAKSYGRYHHQFSRRECFVGRPYN